MYNYHECQCNCPNEDMHYDLMYMQIEEEKYYMTEYDMMNLGAEWQTQYLA